MEVIKNNNSKILFFSDIHGIVDNLDVIRKLDDKEKFDKIVCLGDLYYSGPSYNGNVSSKRVLDFLNSYQDRLIVTRGNCDSDVDIKNSDFPVLDLGLINDNGFNIFITHGNNYSYSKNKKFKYREGALIYGHEHKPYIIKDNDMIYICVGSISLPRDCKASYLIYKNNKFSLYDIDGNLINFIKTY